MSKTEKSSIQKRYPCKICGEKFPKALLEPCEIKGKQVLICHECVKELTKKLKIIAKAVVPTPKKEAGISVIVDMGKQVPEPSDEEKKKLIAEAKKLAQEFPKGSTVKIKSGVYGKPGEIVEVLGITMATEHEKWHPFVVVNLNGKQVLKYAHNIEHT